MKQPHLHGPVVAACDCQTPVWADLSRAHPVGVAVECEQEVLAGEGPHLCSTAQHSASSAGCVI